MEEDLIDVNEPVIAIDFDEDGNIVEYAPETEKEVEDPTDEQEEETKEDKEPIVEEEDTEDTEEVQEDTEEEQEEEEEETNPYSAFAMNLIEGEVLLGLEEGEEITTEEDLVNHVQKTRDYIVENALEEANSKSYGAVNFFLNGGKPEDFAKTFNKESSTVPSYKEEDIEDNEDAKREIAEAYYQSKGFKGNKLKKHVANSVDLDEASEFLDMQNELEEADKGKKVEFEKRAKEQEQLKIEQQQKFNKALEKNTLETSEFIPGRKLDKKTKEKVYSSVPDTWNKINKDLSKYAPVLAYLDHYGLLEGDFSKVIKEVKTTETSKLGKVLKNTSLKRKGDKKVKQSSDDEERRNILRDSVKGVLK